MPAQLRRHAPTVVSLAILFLLAILFRLPYLLNGGDINSDHAFIALQARRMLQGEWSWFLWGSSYQGIVEPAIAALYFVLFGDTTASFMFVPLTALFLLVILTYSLLRERIGHLGAFALCLFQVVAGIPTVLLTVMPYRMWSVMLVFVGVWILDRAVRDRWDPKWFAAAGFTVLFAHYVDLYVIQFLLPFVGYATLAAKDGDAISFRRRMKCLVAGLLAGLLFVALTRFFTPGGLPLSFNAGRAVRGEAPFFRAALFLLGFPPEPTAIEGFWLLVAVCAGALVAGMGLGACLAFRDRNLPPPLKRLALFALAVTIIAVAGFNGSIMAYDVYAARYLTAFIWTAPFLLAPVVLKLGARKVATFALAHSLVIWIAVWVSLPQYRKGALPVRDAVGIEADVRSLGEFLKSRGITRGTADYWHAYQMTYLLDEAVIFVPRAWTGSRYAPYWETVQSAVNRADIYWPHEPRDHVEARKRALAAEKVPFEEHSVGRFTVLLEKRG